MTLIIGIILVSIGLVILIAAVLKTRRKIVDENIISDDEIIQQAFEILDGLNNAKNYEEILLEQSSIEEKLVMLFDKLFADNKIKAAEKVLNLMTNSEIAAKGINTRRGLVFLKMGYFDRAADEFRIAVEQNPDDIKAANNLAYIFNRMKRYEDTIKLLEPFLSDDTNVITLVNLGIAYFHSGDIENAYEILNAAYKKNPSIPEVHLYIGNCLKSLGEEEKANKAFQRYLVLSGKINIDDVSKKDDLEGDKNKIDTGEDDYRENNIEYNGDNGDSKDLNDEQDE